MPWPTKTASASNSSSSFCVWLVPEKPSSQGMSSVLVALHRPERRFRARDDAHERDRLEVRAALAERLEAGLLELVGEVVGGEELAAGAGAAALQPVAGQVGDVGLDAVGGDGGRVGLDAERRGREERGGEEWERSVGHGGCPRQELVR